MLLAIDTSAGSSVAVVDEAAGVIAECATEDTMRHAETIGAFIRDCLAEAHASPAGLDGVAVGMGPGPFTGLRVGIAAARVFALGAGIPVLPVVSHDAIAFARYTGGVTGDFLVVTDARRREAYWSAYRGVLGGLPRRVDGPGLARPDALPHQELPRLEAHAVSAGAVGLLAERLRRLGRPLADDQPLYLRSPDVTPAARRKRVR
ncbi:MAG TPA: tRNA (adenosine(37)-N6)-threonylcarbamoyltransferase complex dimerization subunit type 1 TsaB [Microbacteriaceae bacterium]|nr:tRNA (adenosine(37)-N6)-threonylcarbamoyltransferase complex dimerization subunit type 1 TsaB [Microbacteriaceae bacterium]